MTIGTISIVVGVVLLVLLKLFLVDDQNSSKNKSKNCAVDLFKEEPEFDRTWSFLPSNIFNRSNDD